MTTFNFSDADSDRTGFTFISSDSETFSFAEADSTIDFGFTLDSEELNLSFIELSPNQTIGTVVNNINTTVGVDSEWVLANTGQGSVDSEWVLANTGQGSVDSETVMTIIDSDYIHSFNLIEKQLDGYVSDSIAGTYTIEQASGDGTFNTVSSTSFEKIIIELDDGWTAADENVSGFVVTGNSGVNDISTNLNGAYVEQPASILWIALNSYSCVVTSGRTGFPARPVPWYYNAVNNVSISRVTYNADGTNQLWRFHKGRLDSYNVDDNLSITGLNVMASQNFEGGTQDDIVVAPTPTGTIQATVGGGASGGGGGPLQYVFDIPHRSKTVTVDFTDGDTKTEAATKIKAAFDNEVGLNYETSDSDLTLKTITIDTLADSDVADMTVTVNNSASSTNVLFDNSSNTSFAVNNGTEGVPNSIIYYRNVAYVVPSEMSRAEVFNRFIDSETVTAVDFVLADSDVLQGTFVLSGPATASSLSVNHANGSGTFAWDSDEATIVQLGSVSDSISKQFFRTIYDENRVIQTIENYGGSGSSGVDSDWVLGQISNISSTAIDIKADSDWVLRQVEYKPDSDWVLRQVEYKPDSDWVLTNTYNTQGEIVTLRSETGTTPIVADFSGAIFLGEY